MRKSTWRARLSGVLAAVFLVGLLPTVTLAADNDPITRAGLAEKIYTNDSLKMLIGDDTTEAGFNDIDNCTEDQKMLSMLWPTPELSAAPPLIHSARVKQ